MNQKNKMYRGQDHTYEMINKRAAELFEAADSIHATTQTAWNQACDQLINEFEAEGLTSTAEAIRKHKKD